MVIDHQEQETQEIKLDKSESPKSLRPSKFNEPANEEEKDAISETADREVKNIIELRF